MTLWKSQKDLMEAMKNYSGEVEFLHLNGKAVFFPNSGKNRRAFIEGQRLNRALKIGE